jgi:regulator of protease activity HflC (stomatin/prohibitin superfamily)
MSTVRKKADWSPSQKIAVLVGASFLALVVVVFLTWNTFFRYVGPGKMLVVIDKIGAELPEGQRLADPGQKGIQRKVRGEGWHFVWPVMQISEVHDNIDIPSDMVGIVIAQDGVAPRQGRVLATEPGESGIRREVLMPGSYRLNPYGFKIEKVKMTRIEPGYVGIKRRLLGKEGVDPNFANGPEEKGIIKEEILQPGIYPINTREFEVISCEVGIDQKTYHFDPVVARSTAITFPAKDANVISLDCTIEYELKAEHWPVWLAKFGTLENLERIVIDQHARKICRDRGFNYGAQDFLEGEKREKFQQDFRTELDKICKEDNVVIRSAFIRNIIIPETFLIQKREERIAIEAKITSEALTLTEVTKAEVAKAQQEIKKREQEVLAETDRMVAVIERDVENVRDLTRAELEKLRADYGARIAKLDAERTKVTGEAKAKAKEMEETARAGLYKMKMDVFGKDPEAYLRFTMAKELNPALRLRLFQSGPGTFWTNMGDKNMNFLLPTNGSGGPERPERKEAVAPADKIEKPDPTKK